VEGLIIVAVLLVPALLWGWAKYDEVRALAKMDVAHVIVTTLSPQQLDQIITKALKGMNPLAAVRSRPGEFYAREITRKAGRTGCTARVEIRIRPATTPISGRQGLEVRGGVTDWEGSSRYGVTAVKAIHVADRRVRAVISAVGAADPLAEIGAIGVETVTS
jgi:hypothetical protein